MIKRNLNTTDRVLRFVLAFWWLGPWAPQVSVVWLANILFVIAVISLLESFVGYCWLHNVFATGDHSCCRDKQGSR